MSIVIHTKSLPKRIMMYVIVFMFLLTSGNNIINREPRFNYIYIFMGVLLLLFNGGRLTQRNTLVLAAVGVFYLGNFFLSQGVAFSRYSMYFLRCVGTFFMVSALTRDEFEKTYTNTMVAVCAVCLILFALTQITDVSALYTDSIDGNHYIGLFKVLQYNDRNSGIFWEPGAYQFFLNLALILLLKRNNFQFKAIFSVPSLLLIVSLVTTYSTSGYLTLLCVLMYTMLRTYKGLSMQQRGALLLPMLVLVAVLVAYTLNTEAIAGKFTDTNKSYDIRTSDVVVSWRIIKSMPLWGYGIGSSAQLNLYQTAFATGVNSVGIASMAIMLGMPYIVFHVARMVHFIKVNYRDIWIPFAATLIISLITENFFFYSIYFLFLFNFRKKRTGYSSDHVCV